MEINELYMRRALELARHGELDASPNPMVGAVIVSPDGRVIGEGWHRRCGQGHAEVNAIASVANPAELRDATMYVTLEPCSHYGKTPPCAALIIEKRIPRVVVGCLDPFEKVSGRGINMLREAGVEVVTGCLEDQCIALNRVFMTAHRLHRPYVMLKWAESADGYIDGHISTPLTSMLIHRLRAKVDAILIGSGTQLADRPRLDTRLFAGHSPLRVILDRRGRTGCTGDDRTIMVTGRDMTLIDVLSDLYRRGVTSLLVEGGAQVHESFLADGLWDSIRIERGNKYIGGNVKAPCLPSDCKVVESERADGNLITVIEHIVK